MIMNFEIKGQYENPADEEKPSWNVKGNCVLK